MIVDHLSNLNLYQSIHPMLNIIKEYIKENDLFQLPQGKTEIMGSNLFVLRETYDSKKESECFFEGHMHYGDLQLVLSGTESIGFYSKKNGKFEISAPYLEQKDIEKYNVSSYTQVILSPGMFAIVFPDDLHMPKLMVESSSVIEKIVFKFKLSYQGESPWQKL